MERLLLWFLEGLAEGQGGPQALSLIHISEPTRLLRFAYAV